MLPVKAAGRTYSADAARWETILARPPSSPRVVAHRRAILARLAESAPARAAVEQLFVTARDLQDQLSADTTGRGPGADVVRKLGALGALRGALLALAELPADDGPLAELGRAGREIVGGPGFARLSDLLAWEAGATTLRLEVQLGADGTLRALSVVGRTERAHPAREAAWRRAWRRLLRALRGERWDDEELVGRLCDEAFAPLADAALVVFAAAADLEPYLASLAMRDRAAALGLEATLPAIGGGAGVRLEGLWNPFLLAEAEAGRAPPPTACDLVVEGPGAPVVVVTGPNSGGKTRLLQSISLTVLLGQGGFFVPAGAAAWPWVPSLFASLAVLPSHDAPEGRLGTELLRIRHVFEHARPGCLVVLDELCAGTNPSEAEELVRFVVEQLGELGAFVVVTTHLLDVARRMEQSPPAARMAFREVELDADDRPTYRFAPGVAASSLAHRTAERLGVTRAALAEMVAGKRERASPEEIPESLARPPEARRGDHA